MTLPIEKEEFQTGEPRSKLEDAVVLFLNERREKAYTSQEIMGGVERYHADFSNPEIAQMSTFTIADFTALIYDLAAKGKVTMKTIKGQMYFSAVQNNSRCPKCHTEISQPKKTWAMTTRPDKEGKRLQLTIGFFECPAHGTFKTVLNKQKI